MKEHIFVTGGLGFLGFYIVKRLLKNKDYYIILLARGKNAESAQRRASQAIRKHYKKSYENILKRVIVAEGDITDKNLFANNLTRKKLLKKVNKIYHSAALCDLGANIDTLRKINVEGTRNVLNFALECMKKGKLKEVCHISTVAVAGNKKGIFYERQLDEKQGFNNAYEQSKYEAEKIVLRFRKKGLPITIFRPSIIVGHSKTGWINDFNMFYQPLNILSHSFFKEIPADKNSKYSLSPVDYVAEAIDIIAKYKKTKNETFQIANPNLVSFGYSLNIASRYFGFRKPKLSSVRKFRFNKLSDLEEKLLKPYIPYFNYKTFFDTTNALKILNATSFKWPKISNDLLHILFKYCAKKKYIERKIIE